MLASSCPIRHPAETEHYEHITEVYIFKTTCIQLSVPCNMQLTACTNSDIKSAPKPDRTKHLYFLLYETSYIYPRCTNKKLALGVVTFLQLRE